MEQKCRSGLAVIHISAELAQKLCSDLINDFTTGKCKHLVEKWEMSVLEFTFYEFFWSAILEFCFSYFYSFLYNSKRINNENVSFCFFSVIGFFLIVLYFYFFYFSSVLWLCVLLCNFCSIVLVIIWFAFNALSCMFFFFLDWFLNTFLIQFLGPFYVYLSFYYCLGECLGNAII